MLLRWLGWWFDRNLASSMRRVRRREISPPLFIMGFWRSGTTFLHEHFSTLPGCSAPRTWQCMNASTFAVSGPPNKEVSVARPMDGMQISSFSPQEDEFALLSMGVPSLYHAFLDPKALGRLSPLLDPETWRIAEASSTWASNWLWFLSAVEAQERSRLVIKSPTHIFRARAIEAQFPEATFLWVLREPKEVWVSNIRMWNQMAKLYSGQEFLPEELERFLANAMFHYAGVLEWAKGQGDRHLFVRFDSVERELPMVTKAVATRLGIENYNFPPEEVSSTPFRQSTRTGSVEVSSMGDRAVARLTRIQEDLPCLGDICVAN